MIKKYLHPKSFLHTHTVTHDVDVMYNGNMFSFFSERSLFIVIIIRIVSKDDAKHSFISIGSYVKASESGIKIYKVVLYCSQ